MRNPSWKWLSSRLSARALAAGSNTPSRPCLPAIEQLDDRVLLSAAVEGAPQGDNQILIGLLKGQVELVSHEVQALKLAGDIYLGTGGLKFDLHKVNESFLRIDDVIYKFGQGLIKGEVGAPSAEKTLAELKIEFSKIDTLVGGLPRETGDELKFVLDTFESKATELVNFLGSSTGGGDLDHKVEGTLLSVGDSFHKLDDAVLKFEEASIARKAGKGQQEYLVIKLSDVIVSSLKVSDSDLKIQLLGLEADTAKILSGGGNDTGGDTGGGDNGGGGVITVEPSDDVIA
jgi:hypothetical protein